MKDLTDREKLAFIHGIVIGLYAGGADEEVATGATNALLTISGLSRDDLKRVAESTMRFYEQVRTANQKGFVPTKSILEIH